MNDKPRYRFWKIAIRVIFGVIALAVLYIFLRMAWIRHSGHRQWEHVRGDLLSRGEKLSLMDFVPATIPDEQNFFADPIWQELNDFVEIEQNGHRVKKLRVEDGKRKLDQLDTPLNEGEVATLKKRFPIIEWPKVPLDQTTPRLVMIYMPNRMENKGSISDKKEVAEFVLTVLSSSQPILNHIAELAKRPHAQFPMDYEDNIEMKVPHLSPLLHCAQILGLRAKANLILGNTQSAFDDVMLMFHLADTLKTEPSLISLLVRSTIIGVTLSVIESGLKDHAWTKNNLDGFEKQLGEDHLIQELTFVLRTKRGGYNDCINKITNRAGVAKLITTAAESEEMTVSNKFSLEFLSAFYTEADKAFYNQFIQQWIGALEAAPEKGLKEEKFFQELHEMRNHMVKYPYLLSQLALPKLILTEVSIARHQDQIIQARIACALERYWLKNGVYPTVLTQLTPDYLPTIPSDIVTLQPMHYRLIASDQYQLWSVGWDHVNDEGKPGTTWLEGDWVWGDWKRIKKK